VTTATFDDPRLEDVQIPDKLSYKLMPWRAKKARLKAWNIARLKGRGQEPVELSKKQKVGLVLRNIPVVFLFTLTAIGAYWLATQSGIPAGPLLKIHWAPLHRVLLDAQAWDKANGLNFDNKGLWHYICQSDFVRHGWRKIEEGQWAGLGALVYSLNPLGYRTLVRANLKPPNWWDRVEFFLRIPNLKDNAWRKARGLQPLSGRQVPIAVVAGVLYSGIVIAILLWGAAKLGNYELGTEGNGPLVLSVFNDLVQGPVTYTIIGIISARFFRRPMAPVFLDLMESRAVHWSQQDRNPGLLEKIFYSPAYLLYVNRVQSMPRLIAAQQRRRRGGIIFMFAIVAIAWLAVTAVGVWVKYWVARGA
jgi:hypothetical protein